MEKLMQYVWQHRLWPVGDMRTVDGQRIDVIDPGRLNTDAGPDFFNAKIIIGGESWAGNVEIHIRASDWFRHGHQNDRAYDSVILHVVDRDDMVVRRPDGQVIPQMRMACNPALASRYGELVENSVRSLPCAADIGALEPLRRNDWLSALGYERLYEKADRIAALCSRFSGDWRQTSYAVIARALGFGLNSEPFERLALATPLSVIAKHSDNRLIVEAILFGQSTLLDSAVGCDPYIDALRREYRFMQAKFGLRPVESPGWKMARMRPANFPQRRIALLAAMLSSGFNLMSRVLDAEDYESALALFSDIELSPYWQTHCNFSDPIPTPLAPLSRSSAATLVINTVAPLQMAYGIAHGDDSLTERAVEILNDLKPEQNSITELFGRVGLPPRNAFESQALIQLRRAYCEQSKCLFCRIGHRRLSFAARRPD